MWMMGYNDGGGDQINTTTTNNNNNIQDSFNTRRLRQLIPRPPIATTSTTLIHASTHHDHLLALQNHQYFAMGMGMGEHNKRELLNHTNSQQQIVVSSRWNPTTEQLQTLEELYRRGTRTPSAEEIQLITTQLRRYGKIEGKNVFYWFQNHKARERQKRRRQGEPTGDRDGDGGEKKESLAAAAGGGGGGGGANTSVYEIKQTKNWASPTNSSTIASEKQGGGEGRGGGGGGGGGAAKECKGTDDGWLHFDYDNEAAGDAVEADDDIILQQQQLRKNATWMMNNLSTSSSPITNNLILNSSCSVPITTAATTATATATAITIPSSSTVKHKYFNIFPNHSQNLRHHKHVDDDDNATVAQTLQLFPLLSQGDPYQNNHDQSDRMINLSTNVTPYPFFEFLPLKN